MKTTYTANIQRIVLQYSWHMHENVLAQWASELSKSSKMHQDREHH